MKEAKGAGAHGKESAKCLFRHKARMPPQPIMSLFCIWRLHSEPKHGYSLIKDLREISITPCKPSTIYALLAKLEKAGAIKSHIDDRGAHVRKLYQTTPMGWSLLQDIKKSKMKGIWREFISELIA